MIRKESPLLGAFWLLVLLVISPLATGAPLARLADVYEPGQIVVKLSPAVAGMVSSMAEGTPGITGEAKLDRLSAKYGCKLISPVFRDLAGAGAGGISAAAATLQHTAARFPARAARASTEATAPDLDGIFLFALAADSDVEQAVADYAASPGVEYAQPNFIYRAAFVPNDPYFSSSNRWGQGYADLWGLQLTNASSAWDTSRGAGVVVAVVDTGVDLDHPDLAANVWTNPGEIPGNGVDDDRNGFVDDVHGYDFFASDGNPIDAHGHGTHVAGTIAAVGNNGSGVVGLAFEAKVMAVRGLGPTGNGTSAAMAAAVVYAANNGADVMNASWGGPAVGDRTVRRAIDYAYAAGCVVVAAAGNSSTDTRLYEPARFASVITVSAFDHRDRKADFSNYGSKIDVAAPGGGSSSDDGANSAGRNILSLRADQTDMYGDGKSLVGTDCFRSRGTSMACPHVAALAALILSAHPDFSVEQVRQAIRVSATDTGAAGWDTDSGYGRIDAAAALRVASPCIAHFSSPEPEEALIDRSAVRFRGSAFGPGFTDYTIEYGRGAAPANWILYYASSSPVTKGELAPPLDLSAYPTGRYTARLTVRNSSGLYVDRVTFGVPAKFHAGWPVMLPPDDANSASSPKLVDLDGDGALEIVYASNRGVQALKGDGRPASSQWPVRLAQGWLSSLTTVAAQDLLRGSPGPEVVALNESPRDNYLYLFVLSRDGETLGRGTIATPSSSSLAGGVVLGDVNADGNVDVVYQDGGYIATRTAQVHAVTLDGTPLPGLWPLSVPISGGQKVCVGRTDRAPGLKIAFYDGAARLHLVDGLGHEVPGWPVDLHATLGVSASVVGDPSMIDLDEDGFDEVVAGAGPYLCAYNGDGTPASGFPSVYTSGRGGDHPSAVVASDLDHNGHLELAIAADELVYVLDRVGLVQSGWPVRLAVPSPGGLAVGDVDGDGDQEIAGVSFMPPVLYLWHHDGSAVDGWPFYMAGQAWALGAPAVGDIDGDGRSEVVVHSFNFGESLIYAFEGQGRPGAAAPDAWSTLGGNSANQSRYLSFVQCSRLQAWAGTGQDQPRTITLEDRDLATGEVTRYQRVFRPGQSLTFPNVSVGLHSLSFRPKGFLAQVLPQVFVTPGGLNLTLGPFYGGDLDGDNDVDSVDLTLLRRAYGSRPGMARWNPVADLDGNGVIDWRDMQQLTKSLRVMAARKTR